MRKFQRAIVETFSTARSVVKKEAKRKKRENIWAIHEEKRAFVSETASNFVCIERVFMRHYLETAFLEEADVSTVFVGHQEGETVKLMKQSSNTFFLNTFREDAGVYFVRLYNYFSFVFISISGRNGAPTNLFSLIM